MPIHDSAEVSHSAFVDPTASIWHLAQVRENASIGAGSTIGRGVYVGAGATIGDRCKVQNYALIYEPAQIADGVFIGPGVILTNDRTPRAVFPNGELRGAHDWTQVGVEIGEGASIGARAVLVAPLKIGRWALVGAGSVVTRDVPDYALVMGVPACQIGWVGRTGERLLIHPSTDGALYCPATGDTFVSAADGLSIVLLKPETP